MSEEKSRSLSQDTRKSHFTEYRIIQAEQRFTVCLSSRR